MGAISRFFGRRLNESGAEVPDPEPVGLPLGYKHPPTLEDRIKAMIQVTLSRQAAEAGAETFEEANDFDVGEEDNDPLTGKQFLDPEVTVNDPNVQAAFEAEEPTVRERIRAADAAAAAKQMKAKPPKVAAPADDAEGDESE